jgi:hypothetical protein
MAVFVDLEEETEPPEVQTGNGRALWDVRDRNPALRHRELRGMEGKRAVAGNEGQQEEVEETRPNPNRNMITQALGCYP